MHPLPPTPVQNLENKEAEKIPPCKISRRKELQVKSFIQRTYALRPPHVRFVPRDRGRQHDRSDTCQVTIGYWPLAVDNCFSTACAPGAALRGTQIPSPLEAIVYEKLALRQGRASRCRVATKRLRQRGANPQDPLRYRDPSTPHESAERSRAPLRMTTVEEWRLAIPC